MVERKKADRKAAARKGVETRRRRKAAERKAAWRAGRLPRRRYVLRNPRRFGSSEARLTAGLALGAVLGACLGRQALLEVFSVVGRMLVEESELEGRRDAEEASALEARGEGSEP